MNRKLKVRLSDLFEVTCYDSKGKFKWRDKIENLVVNEGLDDALDKYFKGSSYTAIHYCGLTGSLPTFVPTNTLVSHAWTEVTAYSETVRQAVSWGSVSSQSLNNSSSKAVFSINADLTTLGGAFICTNYTKGGTTGILYGGGAFSVGDKVLSNGDSLNVQVTASTSA